MHPFSMCVSLCLALVSKIAVYLSNEINYYLIVQLLDKCLRGNKIAHLQHACLVLLGTCAKEVQYYCPSHTYPAIPQCQSAELVELFKNLSFANSHGSNLGYPRTRCRNQGMYI